MKGGKKKLGALRMLRENPKAWFSVKIEMRFLFEAVILTQRSEQARV